MKLEAAAFPVELSVATGGHARVTDALMVALNRTSEVGPMARSVPLLHPLLIPSPEAHWRSDVTPKRKLSAVPVSPCRTASDSSEMIWSRRRSRVASVELNSPMSTRSTTNNYSANQTVRNTVMVMLLTIVREYVFTFFQNPKKRDFLRFFWSIMSKKT